MTPAPIGAAATVRDQLQHQLRLVFVALQFLTRMPAPRWVGYQPDWLNQSARHFTLVGGLVGAFGALVLAGAAWGWPPMVAALIALAASLALTGAFHEDGLADSFDALGGAVSRERALQIMKDSRIGSYGAAALVLALAGRAVLWAELIARDTGLAVAALVLSAAWGRSAAVLLMAWLPYAGDAEHAKAKPLAQSVGRIELGWTLAWSLVAATLASMALPAGRLAAALAATVLMVVVMQRWLTRRLGGYTGDTLGATEQLTELAVLLVLVARVGSS
ncbi:MAG TPA: adenosylcobinamide-GDP ribazoletransferase [Ideonella sp.]|uniref:adenosylcobinamide-GDP ribazoletransferase n=1 Tax=Ideonella sp. TaxID=1929293 RepID=UPI002E30B17A|nr:adenosylcobinamide-GDP ribazoletransferase [Ideonella sp.]HEX5686851.1 adenosylcobinamide-GDP ribazoletransferase [Ideonella sp.]